MESGRYSVQLREYRSRARSSATQPRKIASWRCGMRRGDVGATPRARDLPDGELAANGQPNWTRITDASITDPSLPEIVKSTTAPYFEVAFVNASEPLNGPIASPLPVT